ncbi:polysaccharide ABC transporter ATP-binding protein [Mucilaginibacter sp. AW1-3]
MSERIISVENLGKCYQISHERERGYTALRDVIANKFKNIASKNRSANTTEDFWALKDVSFDINTGDAVGVIGRNGAGKSTLLKLLSRITEPSTGRITLNGRVASLLEVGTGFHPELTGRENIYLNGSILGMKHKEIKQKFDEIVDFSGVEQFLDTPVKRYSSGMYVKLAFAVAAHLEPEILVVDEVLAVGDAEFQKKCLGKMNDVTHSGRTVLFVSHNIQAITALCTKGIFLSKGLTEGLRPIDECVNAYLNNIVNNDGVEVFDAINDIAFIKQGRLIDNQSQIKTSFFIYEDINVEIHWSNVQGIPIHPNIELHNVLGHTLFWSIDANIDWDGKKKSVQGEYVSRVTIPAYLLKEGSYFLYLALYTPHPEAMIDLKINVLNFVVVDPRNELSLARGSYAGTFEKFTFAPVLEWNNEKVK